MKVAPFHSKKYPGVYHVCSNCTEGNNIEVGNKSSGKGNGHLCKRCEKLIKQNKC